MVLFSVHSCVCVQFFLFCFNLYVCFRFYFSVWSCFCFRSFIFDLHYVHVFVYFCACAGQLLSSIAIILTANNPLIRSQAPLIICNSIMEMVAAALRLHHLHSLRIPHRLRLLCILLRMPPLLCQFPKSLPLSMSILLTFNRPLRLHCTSERKVQR